MTDDDELSLFRAVVQSACQSARFEEHPLVYSIQHDNGPQIRCVLRCDEFSGYDGEEAVLQLCDRLELFVAFALASINKRRTKREAAALLERAVIEAKTS